jgi:hypothetical protein
MGIRRIGLILFATVFLLAGCRQRQSAENVPSAPPPPQKPAPPAMQTIARVDWSGIRQLSSETDAAHFMEIWNLPESQKLKQQTLDKLSLAPWRLLHRNLDTNTAALMRPLLDDMVEDECYLQIGQATNQPDELVFAIRLNDQRAALWQTNLAAVLESLTAIHPVPAPDHHYGWSLKKHHAPDLLELTRVGDWTIFGAAQNHNYLMDEFLAGIQRGQSPLPEENTNDWLTADLDPARLIPLLGTWNLELGTWNHVSLSVTGDGTNVLTRGTADFSQPLALDLKPWNIPTNLIDERLASFTAIRGFQPWLASLNVWKELQIGSPPDQIIFWGLQNSKMHSCYFATPLSDASNEVSRLMDLVLQRENAWFATNGLAKFVRSEKFNGLEWKGLPYMWPFLRSITLSNRNFVYGGGFPSSQVYPISGRWLRGALDQTNLVYYDSEETGLRVEQWLFMGQFARFVSHKAQLPFHSPALLWLKAISPKLGYSVTHISKAGPSKLSFNRRSSIGFTAIELNLLADWLESPRFPIGLHTLLASPGDVK